MQVGLEHVTGGVLEPGSDLSEPRLHFAAGGGRTGFGRFPGLRSVGAVELSGLQVTVCGLDPSTRSRPGGLSSGLNWFNTALKGRADALIAFDRGLLGGRTEAELIARLPRVNGGPFEFGPVATVPEQHMAKVPIEAPRRSISTASSGLGLSVTMPEWTASAAGWTLATVIDAAHVIAPDVREFTIRVTRVR